MPGNTSIEKTKCDSSTNNSVSKLFYGLLNSRSGLDLIRNKKCQQTTASNLQLRRSFKLLKTHRSESNLPFKNQQVLTQQNNNLNILNNQLTNQSNDKLTGSLGDLKMKSNQLYINNDTTLITKAQVANIILDSEESPPPTPPLRNSSLQKSSINSFTYDHSINNLISSYPNYNRELPSLPETKNDENTKSFLITSRLSPTSDDGGFNSFDFNNLSPKKRNSISVLNHQNLNHNSYRNNHSSINSNNHNNFSGNYNKYNALINGTIQSTNVFHSSLSNNNMNNWSNIGSFDNHFQESNLNLFNMNNQQNNYLSDIDQNSDLDYQNINVNLNNYGSNSQKSGNWSSSASVLSAYTGITCSSTSDYYTASSETITNSPSLNSLNSAICYSINNTCNSPPLSNNCNRLNNSNRYSGSSLVDNNNGINNKNKLHMRQFSYSGSQLLVETNKLAKSPTLLPNTSIAISSLVEKPKRQESKSVLYYVVAKDYPSKISNNFQINNDINLLKKETVEQIDKENSLKNNVTIFNKSSSHSNKSHLNKCLNLTNNFLLNYNSINGNNMPQSHPQNQTDLRTIQKSLHEFYLRHRGNTDDICADSYSKQLRNEENQINNKHSNNYSLTSNDSFCSDSSTVSPTDSPTLFSNLHTINLPTKPNFLNVDKKLSAEEEQRLNELKASAIYSNVNFDTSNGIYETKEDVCTNLDSLPKETRLSFRERCSPFEKNNLPKQRVVENKIRNELKNINQPNNVKNIAKQFDSLSNLNCDLNANRVSPISNGKVSQFENALNDVNALSDQKSSIEKSTILKEKIDENNEKLNDNLLLDLYENKLELSKLKDGKKVDDNEPNKLDFKLKLKENGEKIKLFLEYLHKNKMPELDYNKIVLHIEEVDKVTKLMISLTNRLNKIESILQFRNQQTTQTNSVQLNDDQLFDVVNKYKQSSSTDSLLADEKNIFSSILSLSSISLNNLNCNGNAFFTSVEMLISKKNKILDQLEEATQLKQMIERRCKNLNERIICKNFDFTNINFAIQKNQEFILLKDFNFINSMQEKHEFSLKCKQLEQNV